VSGGALMAAEIAEQPAVLGRLIDARAELLAEVRAILPPAPIRVVIVARGSSDHAAVYGRYLLEYAARTPVALAAPSLHTRYGVDTDYSGYVAIAVSQSGRTPEIVSVLEQMRASGATTIAVTNELDSPLARAAGLALALQAGDERSIPATKTFTAQLAIFALLAEAIGPVPWRPTSWQRVVAAVEAVIGDVNPATQVAAEIADAHGLIAVLDTELPLLAFSAAGSTAGDVDALSRQVRRHGGRVFSIADTADADLALPAAVPEALAAIPAAVRAQQLALALASYRGLDADAPTGLSKVTATV